MPELLALSWTVQVAIASGYAAYIIAYRGIRSHHSTQDALFLALVFSLIATATLYWWRSCNPIAQGLASFLAALSAGLLWRRHGIDALTKLLRKDDTTWSDDTPSAWVRLQENRKHAVSQLSVLLTDGTWLHCDETGLFDGAPWAPFVLGSSGDVLMYTTSVKPKDGPERRQTTTLDPMGDRITYVPAAQIARILLRHHHEGSSLRPVAASPAASSVAAPSVGYLPRYRSGLAGALRRLAAAISSEHPQS
jgi:hypothetical protein